LLFEIPATIWCPAASETEVPALIDDVLMGRRRSPRGFAVKIEQDDIESFIDGLDVANSSMPASLGVHNVLITNIDAPRVVQRAGT
jgi:hypothetical protein